MTTSHHHESESVYSTVISKQLLTPLNEYIHNIPSVSHPAELFIASCGYAFNPVMFPFWPILLYGLSYQGLASSSHSSANEGLKKFHNEWHQFLISYKPVHGSLFTAGLYVLSVLMTLAFTEIAKASFATTRPRPPAEGYDSSEWRRRYGKLVASLKSKHSFPSGDSAQAMNLCMFVWRYVPLDVIPAMGNSNISLNALTFGIFLPGVVFARIFYRCHWFEDCVGGVLLSWTLHRTLMPILISKLLIELGPILDRLKSE